MPVSLQPSTGQSADVESVELASKKKQALPDHYEDEAAVRHLPVDPEDNDEAEVSHLPVDQKINR